MIIFRTLLLITVLFIFSQIKAQDYEVESIEIKKENASQNAQKIMSDNFYWDMLDEFSPFGNDTGNDTFHLYYDWKKANSNKKGIEFLNQDLKYVNFDFNITEKEKVQESVQRMTNKYIDLNIIDNEIISLAFTQLFLYGKIETEIKNLCLKAIEREMLYLDFWETDSKIREERLLKMKSSILKSN